VVSDQRQSSFEDSERHCRAMLSSIFPSFSPFFFYRPLLTEAKAEKANESRSAHEEVRLCNIFKSNRGNEW